MDVVNEDMHKVSVMWGGRNTVRWMQMVRFSDI